MVVVVGVMAMLVMAMAVVVVFIRVVGVEVVVVVVVLVVVIVVMVLEVVVVVIVVLMVVALLEVVVVVLHLEANKARAKNLITGEPTGTISAHPAIKTDNNSPNSCNAPLPTPYPSCQSAEGQAAGEDVAARGSGDCFKSDNVEAADAGGNKGAPREICFTLGL